MTDREKLIVSLLSEADDDATGVGVLEVMAMLYEIGDEYRQFGLHPLAVATVEMAAAH